MRPLETRARVLERLAASMVNALQRSGLSRIAYSSALRRVGKRLLFRAEDKGPNLRVIASGLGKGLFLCVLPETPKSYWLGTHEPHMQAALQKNLKSGTVVYDCGANVGYFSVMMAQLVGPKGHVYAFEPSPQSFECLQRTTHMNELNNVTVVSRAVWHRRETLRFACAARETSLVSDHIEGVFGETTDEGTFLEVKAMSLDEFIFEDGNPKPDFIKLDVEGAEGKALLGARRLLSEHRPGLLMEIHGEPGREVWAILKELNYTVTNIATDVAPETVEDFAIWISQYLAVPLNPQPSAP